MKPFRYAVPALVLLAATAGRADAQQATQTVSYEVQAISEIAFTGSPSLVVSAATAGSAPTAVTANASYAVTTNETNRKITAAIDTNMPTGVTLSVNLAAPTGGSSAGAVTLGTTAQDVVTGITQVNQGGLSVTYSLSATAAAGVVASGTRTVTYTITAGA
ncbi:MAG TPA: hypothetical protein VFQ45_14425 [Longimicrobium sp.]|nr:hypothetical protein [Longimicrobium sp.]